MYACFSCLVAVCHDSASVSCVWVSTWILLTCDMWICKSTLSRCVADLNCTLGACTLFPHANWAGFCRFWRLNCFYYNHWQLKSLRTSRHCGTFHRESHGGSTVMVTVTVTVTLPSQSHNITARWCIKQQGQQCVVLRADINQHVDLAVIHSNGPLLGPEECCVIHSQGDK